VERRQTGNFLMLVTEVKQSLYWPRQTVGFPRNWGS